MFNGTIKFVLEMCASTLLSERSSVFSGQEWRACWIGCSSETGNAPGCSEESYFLLPHSSLCWGTACDY